MGGLEAMFKLQRKERNRKLALLYLFLEKKSPAI